MPSYIQHGVNEPSGPNPTSPQTVTLTGTVAGNMIVFVQLGEWISPTTPNAPSDGVNTYHPCGASSGLDASNNYSAMFYAPSIAGGSVTISTSWSGTSGYIALYAFEVSGVTAYDTGAFATTNNAYTTANASCGPFNVNYANEIVIAATINSDNASTNGAGFTLIAITPSYADCLEYALPGAGSITPTAVMNGVSQTWQITAGGFYLPSGPSAPGAGQIVSAAAW